MKYCSKCGGDLEKEAKFCRYCGTKINDIEQQEDNSMGNRKKNIKEKDDIVYYIIGGICCICSLVIFPSFSGLLLFIFGISLMPIIYKMPFTYKILKKIKRTDLKEIKTIVPIILFLIFCSSILVRNVNNNMKDDSVIKKENEITKVEQNKSNESETSLVEQEKENTNKTLEEKWNAYYKDNNIEVIDVDSDTLYTYGTYYKDKIILTGIEIYDKTSEKIKGKIENSDSVFYNFVFKFDDKSEIKKYEKGETVIIIGEVSSSTTSKTVFLNKCHIVSFGTKAQEKIEELNNNKIQHIEYIKGIKEEQDRKGNIENTYIEILDSKVIYAYHKKVLVVSLLYKNNSNENKEFNYTADVKVFQNGVELNSSVMKCSWYDDNYKDNGDVEVQPGITVVVNKCFLIEDTSSDIEVNVEDWLFPNLYDKLTKTFKLN